RLDKLRRAGLLWRHPPGHPAGLRALHSTVRRRVLRSAAEPASHCSRGAGARCQSECVANRHRLRATRPKMALAGERGRLRREFGLRHFLFAAITICARWDRLFWTGTVATSTSTGLDLRLATTPTPQATAASARRIPSARLG